MHAGTHFHSLSRTVPHPLNNHLPLPARWGDVTPSLCFLLLSLPLSHRNCLQVLGEVSHRAWSSRHDKDAQQQEDNCLHSWYTLSFHKWQNERETRNLSRRRMHSVQSSSHTMWDDVATTWTPGMTCGISRKRMFAPTYVCVGVVGWENTVWLQSIFWVHVCPLQCCLGMWQRLQGLSQGFPSTTLSAHFLTLHT